MRAFVLFAMAAVAAARPGSYANHHPAVLAAAPVGTVGAIAAPGAVQLKTIAAPALKTAAVGIAHQAVGYAPVGYAGTVGYAAAPAVSVQRTFHQTAVPVATTAVRAVPTINKVKVPVTQVRHTPAVVRQDVTIPVQKKVHYADQAVVSGYNTAIHKPAISAPAIGVPTALRPKTVVNPAQVSVEKYAAEVKKVTHVEQPYDVPYSVPEPYAVPKPYLTKPVEVRKTVVAPARVLPARVHVKDTYVQPVVHKAVQPVVHHAATYAAAPVVHHAATYAAAPVAPAVAATYAAAPVAPAVAATYAAAPVAPAVAATYAAAPVAHAVAAPVAAGVVAPITGLKIAKA